MPNRVSSLITIAYLVTYLKYTAVSIIPILFNVICFKFWILVFALVAIMLIETVTPAADDSERPVALESNPKQDCFTEGNSGLMWNTPIFQYCSTDLDCKGSKKPGFFGATGSTLFAWIFNLIRRLPTELMAYAAAKVL